MEVKKTMSLIYLYDGSFEGLLSAVHAAYYSRETPDEILESKNICRQICCNYREIETDTKKFNAVYNSIGKKISASVCRSVYNIYLSSSPDKATIIYNYLKKGYVQGARVEYDLADPWVIKAFKLNRYVIHEANKLCGFVRFSAMDNGIMFSKINPENNVLPIISRYFADRMKNDPWVICDETRMLASIYDTKKWVIYSIDNILMQNFSECEENYRKLWKKFYYTISIEERKNEKLRTHNMPKKYWRNLTELQ